MSINFKRNRTQQKYESILGISSVEELVQNKQNFKTHVLSREEANQLKVLLQQDAIDFFYSAVVSFSEGIDAIYLKRYSWATVKFYYSIFYLLRTSMACSGYALLRNCSMYRLKVAAGEMPYGTNNKKYNSTHGGTISHYKDVFAGTDILLTNLIDDVDVYQWMENVRDIVNYREVGFEEPECLEVWNKYKEALDIGTLSDLLELLVSDLQYIYCFQEEYAVVAIPIKRMQQTIADLAGRGWLSLISTDRKEYANRIIKSSERNISIFDNLNVNH